MLHNTCTFEWKIEIGCHGCTFEWKIEISCHGCSVAMVTRGEYLRVVGIHSDG